MVNEADMVMNINADTGIRMDEEFLKRAFEPYAQKNNTSLDSINGVGLGLAIVKQMVERMGGRIKVESKVNEGTKYTILLPFKIDPDPVIRKKTEADGIISTKAALIKRRKELKMFTVLRYFLLDSMAYENIRQQQHAVKPDYIEVLPGVMPKVIGKVCKMSKTPIIAGGLISDKESVMAALSAGAIAVSSTNHEVWKM